MYNKHTHTHTQPVYASEACVDNKEGAGNKRECGRERERERKANYCCERGTNQWTKKPNEKHLN